MSIAVTNLECTDDVVTLTVASVAGLVVGETVFIIGTGYNKLDGHHQLSAVGVTTVQYTVNNQDDITSTAVSAVLVEQPTWIDADDVEVFLGIASATANDTAFLEEVVAAANVFAFRRRAEAGYNDNPTTAPNASAKMGTSCTPLRFTVNAEASIRSKALIRCRCHNRRSVWDAFSSCSA